MKRNRSRLVVMPKKFVPAKSRTARVSPLARDQDVCPGKECARPVRAGE